VTYAVVFPGQGSQSVGMLADLADAHNSVKVTFAEASDVMGQDLWALAQTGSAEALSDTRVTQPLMFTAGVAVWQVMRKAGFPMPSVIAGHSLGEYAAMVATGVMTYSDGIKLVKRRSELMATAVPEGEGGMAALIGMDDQAVVDMCQSISAERVVEAANFNAPGQVAISGHLDALQVTIEKARELGCRKALMLAVSVPNHSSLMQGAGQELAQNMDEMNWSEPRVPLLQNATAEPAPDLKTLVERLKSHVYSPVYWTRTIKAIRDEYRVTMVLEAGPGKVLTGLNKRIDRRVLTLSVDSPKTLEAARLATGIAAVS